MDPKSVVVHLLPFSTLINNRLSVHQIAGRQSGSDIAAGPTILSTGAIIGIAVVGSAVLFGILTVVILRYLRFRYKQKNNTRHLDLCEDTEDDVFDPLRSMFPLENGLTSKLSHDTSTKRVEAISQGPVDQRFQGPRLEKTKPIPPAHGFETNGLQDSWPLVGWVESPFTLPQTVQKHPVISTGNIDRRISCSAFPLTTDSEPSWPKPTLARSSSYARDRGGTPTQFSGHSTRSSVKSMRLSSYRTSTSDNQLTSILRSTSQRLREAQRRSLSQSLSVLSQVSGAPPKIQPSSPPGDQRSKSCEALVEPDDTSIVDSVHSSVLNSVSQTPNQDKIIAQTAYKILGIGKKTSPTVSVISDPDSLCHSNTLDLFIPAELTSPSRRDSRSDQKSEMKISSTTKPLAMAAMNQRKPLLTTSGNSMKNYADLSVRTGYANDPFVSEQSKAECLSEVSSVKGPRPFISQKLVAEQRSTDRGPEAITLPLRPVSTNEKSATRLNCPIDSSKAQDNPFQWSPHCSPSLGLLPGKKPIGMKQKGHRRRKTVRLSYMVQPTSFGVVLEEPECLSKLTDMQGVEEPQESIQALPGELRPLSEDSKCDKLSSTRPPSIPVFQPFFAIPSARVHEETQTTSDGPYSPTISFYDYYSSASDFRSDQLRIPDSSQSPTPSTKKSRRRACNFTTDMTHARDLTHLQATSSTITNEDIQSSSRPTPDQPSKSVIANDTAVVSNLAKDSYESSHSSWLPNAKDSITTSISLLRRMNSEVSNNSTNSILSESPNASPTIPALRDGGVSHTKRICEGTVNYLSLGAKTPSPIMKRERVRISQLAGKTRVRHISSTHEDSFQHYNALRLKLPAIEDSPTKSSSLGPLIGACSQANWPSTPSEWPSASTKWYFPPAWTTPPTPQLRPISSTATSQENCYSCKTPLSPLRLNPRDSSLASRYHEECFKCSTCQEPLRTSFSIEKIPYCKQHYYEKVNEICEISTTGKINEGRDHLNERWSKVMTTPLKKSVRNESQLEMPSPQGGSPKSMIRRRGSLGLYDEMGFLRSSPDRGQELDSF